MPLSDESGAPIQEVRVETKVLPTGRVGWTIWVDGKNHGGGSGESSHEAALVFAAYHTRDWSNR